MKHGLDRLRKRLVGRMQGPSLWRAWSVKRWLGVGVVLCHLVWACSVFSTLTAEVLTHVFQEQRSLEEDTIWLRNGETISGTWLDTSIAFRTGYGLLVMDADRIAGISFQKSLEGLDEIRTVFHDRFTGFLELDGVTFQVGDSELRKLKNDHILKVVLRRRPFEENLEPGGPYFLLRNGDFFKGTLNSTTIEIQSELETHPIAVESILSLILHELTDSQVSISVQAWETMNGHIALEDWPITMAAGPALNLYRNRLHILYNLGGIPPFVTGHVDAGSSSSSAWDRSIPLHTPGIVRNQFVWLAPGEFTMGSPSEEEGRDDDEGPQTRVNFTQGIWMCRYETTQSEFRAVMGNNPSNFTGEDRRPVERVSWREAMGYCVKRTELEQTAGILPNEYEYRLPTEAEWEYACRAGSNDRFCFGQDPEFAVLDSYAWFTSNADSTTHPVGLKKPNAWGLYDMHGNVWEWCMDRWSGVYPGGQIKDYQGPTDGSTHSARGGSWLYSGAYARSANRDNYSASNRLSDVGFRVVISSLQKQSP